MAGLWRAVPWSSWAHRRSENSQVPGQSGATATPTPASMTSSSSLTHWLGNSHPSTFSTRHLGIRDTDLPDMLREVGSETLEAFTADVVPPFIRREHPLETPEASTEEEALRDLKSIMSRNHTPSCYWGQGYHPSRLPPTLLRNLLENPGWYTPYTSYQAEIAQGRLEMLLNFQTLISDLTGLPFANASLLDEATACGEALGLAFAHGRQKRTVAVADIGLHPQNLEVLRTRARFIGVDLQVQDVFTHGVPDNCCAVLVQTPDTRGRLQEGLRPLAANVHAAGALLVAVVDPLAQCLLDTPASWEADIAVGSTQRFGLPMGAGGPHAGFMAVSDPLKRRLPGRIVGVSKDSRGNPAYRLALQTREQHIRRDKATSNICTAQVLPAVIATAYALYHGPESLRRIAERIARLTAALRAGLEQGGIPVAEGASFDTLVVLFRPEEQTALLEKATAANLLLRPYADGAVGISLHEDVEARDLQALLDLFGATLPDHAPENPLSALAPWLRTTPLLPQEVFHLYHTEHEMLRYLNRLQSKDVSLVHSMISLGSCTMKLNAAAEMIPVTWPEVGGVHPAAPADQQLGYDRLREDLETWLSDITALPVCSLQPNAGSQGELAGLLAIRDYHVARGDADRDVCLIPASAHGTNPASAVMAGFRVVAVGCDERGNIDLADLEKKIGLNEGKIAALMMTYPSTHGVFEVTVKEVCDRIHDAGGQVYMDGANMNAQVGLTAPGLIGADVCHLNLHKTFCIPHGGGGPGMGPICAGAHLAPHMPSNPLQDSTPPLAISATPLGSASILVISWMYIRMMGPDGLRQATQLALLNANYMARKLSWAYPVLYTGENGRVAHEFILDLRDLTAKAGLVIDDIAKRLMDYGFHAPTMSFPVPGTLMIEPTESESRAELDRFCEAMVAIRGEIQAVIDGHLSPEDSPLHHAPHTAADIAGEWHRPYSREEAAFPLEWVRERKVWPAANRIDNTYGDRNLVCTCEWNPDV